MTTATELMKEKSESYLASIKNRCNETSWNDSFDNPNFVEQCFDDIQSEVMSEVHGADYYDHNGKGDEIGADYDLTTEIRVDFTRDANEYIKEKKEEVQQKIGYIN